MYPKFFHKYISRIRSHKTRGIGYRTFRCTISYALAKSLPPNASVLDIDYGTGELISKTLEDEDLAVYGIDAPLSTVQIFKQNFPSSSDDHEASKDSSFSYRQFDAIIA